MNGGIGSDNLRLVVLMKTPGRELEKLTQASALLPNVTVIVSPTLP